MPRTAGYGQYETDILGSLLRIRNRNPWIYKKRQELRFGRGEDPPNPDEDSPTFRTLMGLVYYVQDRLGYKVQPCHYCRKFLK